ncbi:hypothetical protein D9615_006158 [Tricholomella constricta]|uniref:Glucose-methanol-choline oxidoreductase N-terminal domain-containing protein n=1 Tax=Tricholomella constricta TaxID=117010 RepID=A0A8H5M405_9AGAR|nr:hypothetical protein D9615_006158 [Tricholomella constricta]
MCSYPTTSIQDVSKQAYTYIIVGGGTAGCILASRLSEDPKATVLLIERGPVVDSWSAKVPLLSSNFTDQKAPVYKWQSAPLPAVNGKTVTMVTGKALGGSSKINGLLYTRSTPGEYNAWQAAGRKGWSWRHVEPYFNKSETYEGHTSHRGTAGPWKTRNVDKIRFQPVASNIHVAPTLGIPLIFEDNDPTSSVVSCKHLDATIDSSGHRSATSDAFLPKSLVRARKNLYICTGTIASALDIQSQKVVGVYLESDKSDGSAQRFYASAEREVILCAGAISTPQLLLLSGVGPADHLLEHNIPLLKDLPGVGAHLQDHISVPVIYKVPVTDSIEVLMAKPFTAVSELLKYCFTGKGIFGTQVQQANIVLRSTLLDANSHVVVTDADSDLNSQDPANVPDIEIMLIPVNPTDRKFDGLSKSYGTFSYLCTVLRPKSTGSVRLASTNPREQPLCDLGTLSHNDDRIPLRKCLRLALALGRAVRKSGYPLEDLLVPATEEDGDLDAFINENLTTTYHYSSSCRMDEEARAGVVDDELRVHGISGPAYPRLVDMAALLAFPVIVKATRAAINIFFLVDWKRNTSTGAVNQFDTTTSLKTWMVKTAWILELLDNAYISFLFLWRLGTQSHLFNGEKIGRVDSEISKGSFTSKLKSLFWIASTNFVFPLIFGLCQIILLFRGKNILVAASVEMVNVYVSIISTVFATIWASTVSGKSNVLSSNSDNTKLHLETIKFRRGQEQGATYSHTEVGLQDDSSHTELGSMKKENWGGTIDLA